jgi:hypothetical protein
MFGLAAYLAAETRSQLITVYLVAAICSAIWFVLRYYYGGIDPEDQGSLGDDPDDE